MTGRCVPEGAIYYASSRRRRPVDVSKALRQQVAATVAAVREMLASGELPPPLSGTDAQQRCKACSLMDRCQPAAAQSDALRQQRSHLFDPEA